MITRDGKLDVFERFQVDRTLPKHHRKADGAFSIATRGDLSLFQVVDAPSTMIDAQGNILISLPSGLHSRRLGWWTRLCRWVRGQPVHDPDPTITMTIPEFFGAVRQSALELEVVQGRATGYEAAIRRAIAAGQVALREQLERSLVAVRAETQLLAMGLGRFVEEPMLVEFVKKCPKGLRLDWIANFTRVIPDHVMEKKIAADERGCFDNYVILHYDPGAKSWAETEAEKQRRRDPILFGVMEGRRRLYFVGDWTDEFCDLTLDQIADTLGAAAIREIPRSV